MSGDQANIFSINVLADVISSFKDKHAVVDALYLLSPEKVEELAYSIAYLNLKYIEISQHKKKKKTEKIHKETNYQKIIKSLYELKSSQIDRVIPLKDNFESIKAIRTVIDQNEGYDISINSNLHNAIINIETNFLSVPLYGAELRGRFYNYLIAHGETVNSISEEFKISIRTLNSYIKFFEFITQYPYFIKINLSFTFVRENLVTIKNIIKSNIEFSDLLKHPLHVEC